jgi:hypothetical protein
MEGKMGPDPPAAGSPSGDRLQKALDKSKVTEFNSRLAQLRQEQDTESLKRELDELKALNSVVRRKLVDAGALQAFRETFGREMRPLDYLNLVPDTLREDILGMDFLRAEAAPIRADAAPVATPKPGHRRRTKDPQLQKLRDQVREMHDARLTQFEMCRRLGNGQRPPEAAWRNLAWPVAFKDKRYSSSVRKWLSEASR